MKRIARALFLLVAALLTVAMPIALLAGCGNPPPKSPEEQVADAKRVTAEVAKGAKSALDELVELQPKIVAAGAPQAKVDLFAGHLLQIRDGIAAAEKGDALNRERLRELLDYAELAATLARDLGFPVSDSVTAALGLARVVVAEPE